MKNKTFACTWSRLLWLGLLLAIAPALANAAEDKDTIVSTAPMEITAEDGSGVHGQFVVSSEILNSEMGNELIYTITSEPLHGQVGLSGDDDEEDFFATKTSHFGYFAYKPEEDFEGRDSFGYSVRNVTTGLVFKNMVEIAVTPPLPIMLDKLEVEASHLPQVNLLGVKLTTRPNTPVTQKVPSHEDIIAPADRIGFAESKIVYMLDDKIKPQHGTARLNHITGLLTYSPNPGFIGEDRFQYYTVDQNNPQFGVENTVTIKVEPIRNMKHVSVDRSRSREVDLVFVINNSPSMAKHQERIATSLKRFRQLFHTHDLDYRIGVLTTDFVDQEPGVPSDEQPYFKKVRSIQLDDTGKPLINRWGRPKRISKSVASNGNLVALPVMSRPWVTPQTPDGIFEELVKVGTKGDSNRTAFTAVYNFVVNYQNKGHSFLRPGATTIVVFFMDEEETRMAAWEKRKDGTRQAKWMENGKLPNLINEYNADHPGARQTLVGYINYWVLRPFIIVKGNQRGKLEINAVVTPKNISHRRAAELTGGTVLNIESDFSEPLAALGDRIANTVAVALDPVSPGATFYQKSLRVLVDGQPEQADPQNGYTYDARTHNIRFNGAAKKRAFLAKLDITYEEHL